MKDPIVVGAVSAIRRSLRAQPHRIKQFPPGSRGGNQGKRRYNGCCRFCDNINDENERASRQTTYYCDICMICLHPECFVDYHLQLPPNTTPIRRPHNLTRNLTSDTSV